MTVHCRLGQIAFMNSLPVQHGFIAPPGVAVEPVKAVPSQLNTRIALGQLDASPVSSAFYLRHQASLERLPGVCISAEGPVESVLLCLPPGWTGGPPETVLNVPESSETSIALAQWALAQQAGWADVPHRLQAYASGEGQGRLSVPQPLITIGDEALHLGPLARQTGWQVIDLAEFWFTRTGLPFVFAVWVARKPWAEQFPEAVQAIEQALVKSLERFDANPQPVLAVAQAQCPALSEEVLRRYLTQSLQFHGRPEHAGALRQFAGVLQWVDGSHRPALPRQLLHGA